MLEKYRVAEDYIAEIEKELYDISDTEEFINQLRDDIYSYVEKDVTYILTKKVQIQFDLTFNEKTIGDLSRNKD